MSSGARGTLQPLSNPKLKPPPSDDEPQLTPLRARRESSAKHVLWGLVAPKDGESCRWQGWDGRWVALSIGQGDELGQVVVTASDGRRDLVASYEGALALARAWRES
jgi:hypothetical protein